MSSNTLGKLFSITTFGESHGIALGVVIDGCPAGIALSEKDFLSELARRAPGQSAITTPRKEADMPTILSGVFEGKTTGMPITITVENTNQKSADYEAMRSTFRPGHADKAYMEKFGRRDHRGGGRSSGRETVARVIAGVVARKILPSKTAIIGHTIKIGAHEAMTFDPKVIEKNPLRCADPNVAKLMEDYVMGLKEAHNSTGGLVEIRVQKPPKNLGDPVFGKLKNRLADGIMSIGAVTGFSYGAGFDTAEMTGIDYIEDTDNFGGMLGGISTGEDIVLTVSIKPSTSVGDIAKKGRHDPCIVPRVIPVLEAMVAIVMADCYLMQKAYE
ncbi:MAG: chorismate synthase [Candidatus Peribacteraceae bacterium]|nr:chorismate synthase [Candidatus Peribacteraceae bacterium]